MGRSHSWDGQEHHDQLLLAENGVADERIGESLEAAAALFDEESIGCYVIAIY